MNIQELFDNLPENLQDKIIRMNPHPITDILKSQIKDLKTGKIWNGRSSHRLLNNCGDTHSISLDMIHDLLNREVYREYQEDYNNSDTTLRVVREWIENNFYTEDDDASDDD